MAPNPEKIAQKTTFLPAFGVWVGYRSSGPRAIRGDYKRNSDIKALKKDGIYYSRVYKGVEGVVEGRRKC